MVLNTRALVLLGILLSIALFLVGFRYGKYVEHADKTFVPPAPTSAPITLAPTKKPFSIVPYTGKICDISFLYPNYMEEDFTSTQSSRLFNNPEVISFTCDKTLIDGVRLVQKNASPSASITILNQKVPIYVKMSAYSVIVKNLKNGQSVLIETTKNLSKLVFPSLEFVK